MAKKITQEQKKEVEETQKINEELIKSIGDEVVFKHKLICELVMQVLKTHKKEHDDFLYLKLYNRFEKELEK